MTTTKQGRFIFLKKGHKTPGTGLYTTIHTPTQTARTIFIPLLGALMIVYTIGFAVSYTSYHLSPYYMAGLGFLIFIPLYVYFYALHGESIDLIEYAEDESKNDVIIDSVGRKLIIHDIHLKEDFTIDFEDITGFEVKIDVTVDEGVKTVWKAWVNHNEGSYPIGESEWKEDLEDLIEKIKAFIETETPEEDAINLYGESYEVLGVSQEATLIEVKKAYRSLAKKYHPDIGGDEESFKRINEAYQSLIEVRC